MNNKKPPFIILKANSEVTLATKVCNAIKDGYTPSGSLVVCLLERWEDRCGVSNEDFAFFQAMHRPMLELSMQVESVGPSMSKITPIKVM